MKSQSKLIAKEIQEFVEEQLKKPIICASNSDKKIKLTYRVDSEFYFVINEKIMEAFLTCEAAVDSYNLLL